jgi:hypothetical protein
LDHAPRGVTHARGLGRAGGPAWGRAADPGRSRVTGLWSFPCSLPPRRNVGPAALCLKVPSPLTFLAFPFPWAVRVPSCLPNLRIARGTLRGGVLCRPSPRSLSARCSPSPQSWSRSRPPPRRRLSMASTITVISFPPLHPQSCLGYVLAMPVRQHCASLQARFMRRESQSGQQHPPPLEDQVEDELKQPQHFLFTSSLSFAASVLLNGPSSRDDGP